MDRRSFLTTVAASFFQAAGQQTPKLALTDVPKALEEWNTAEEAYKKGDFKEAGQNVLYAMGTYQREYQKRFPGEEQLRAKTIAAFPDNALGYVHKGVVSQLVECNKYITMSLEGILAANEEISKIEKRPPDEAVAVKAARQTLQETLQNEIKTAKRGLPVSLELVDMILSKDYSTETPNDPKTQNATLREAGFDLAQYYALRKEHRGIDPPSAVKPAAPSLP